jgi:hypothetical protein
VGRQGRGFPALRFRFDLAHGLQKGLLTRIAIQELLRSRAAANPVLPPKAKPRATGEHFVVSSIRSREIARAQGSGVRHREDALKTLDFGNGPFSVHPSQYLTERRRRQFGAALACRGLRSRESVSMG